MDLTKCRFCLGIINDDRWMSIVERTIREVIDRIFDFQLLYAEHLPSHVCYVCSSTVFHFQQFSSMVQSNQLYLQEELLHDLKSTALQEAVPSAASNCVVEVPMKNTEQELNYIDKIKTDPDHVELQNETPENEELGHGGSDLCGFVKCEEYKVVPATPTDSQTESDLTEECNQIPANSCRLSFVNDKSERQHEEKDVGTESFQKREADAVLADKSYNCYQCTDQFNTYAELTQHRQQHIKQCPVCNKKISIRSIKEHIASHESAFRCKLCEKTFSYKRNFNAHNAIFHPSHGGMYESNVIKCDQCDQSFGTSEDLADHQLQHTQPYSGYQEEKSSKTSTAPAKPKTFRCDICDKSFAYNRNLKTHVTTHHPPGGRVTKDKPLNCDQCEQTFANKTRLVNHLLNEHKQQCPICRKLLGNSHFKSHVEMHKKTFRCDSCERSFSCSNNLTRHRAVFHPPDDDRIQDRKHSCDQCEQSFSSNALLVHHWSKHKKECPVCKKRIGLPHFQTHIISHQNSFRCEVCNKAFSSGKSLKRHHATAHVELEERNDHYAQSIVSPNKEAGNSTE